MILMVVRSTGAYIFRTSVLANVFDFFLLVVVAIMQ